MRVRVLAVLLRREEGRVTAGTDWLMPGISLYVRRTTKPPGGAADRFGRSAGRLRKQDAGGERYSPFALALGGSRPFSRKYMAA